jgi:enoyl-CoA hydratase/carnithine racemase
MGSERVSVSREGGVAHVELVREDRLNAMDGEMFAAIGETFRALGVDPKVRAVLLSGRGRHFTSGLDLHYAGSHFGSTAEPGRAAEARLRHILWLQDCFNAVASCRVPVVAAIQGGCIGAGVDLASACDIRLAAADAFFQVAEVDVAITADLGTLQRLVHLVPDGLVRELVYTGRKMDADEALRCGLVNRIEADRESTIGAGHALARAIAAKSPLAVAGAKMSLDHGRGRTVEEGLRQVALWNAAALASEDLAKAVAARLGGAAAEFEDFAP